MILVRPSNAIMAVTSNFAKYHSKKVDPVSQVTFTDTMPFFPQILQSSTAYYPSFPTKRLYRNSSNSNLSFSLLQVPYYNRNNGTVTPNLSQILFATSLPMNLSIQAATLLNFSKSFHGNDPSQRGTCPEVMFHSVRTT